MEFLRRRTVEETTGEGPTESVTIKLKTTAPKTEERSASDVRFRVWMPEDGIDLPKEKELA